MSACIRAADKVLAKHAMRDAGIPTPDFFAFNETAFQELGRGPGAAGDRGAAAVPDRGQAGRAGLGARDQVRAHAADVPAALVAAFSYDRKVLLERYVSGRDLAVSILEQRRRPQALPIVEAVPEQEDFYDFEARYEIGRTRFVCPAELDDELARGRRRSRSRSTGCWAARASRAST